MALYGVLNIFLWRIVYEQRVANMSIRISFLKIVKVLLENRLVKFIQQEM
jgi:hypothetical protein